jgi:hypothetical protein
MALLRLIHLCHSRADLIWPFGPFKEISARTPRNKGQPAPDVLERAFSRSGRSFLHTYPNHVTTPLHNPSRKGRP